MTRSDTFYQASGTSPPDAATATSISAASSESPPLPEELIEDLARLLAEAIVADIRQYPNIAELKANHEVTVESPTGHNRRRTASTPTDRPPVGRQTRRVAEAS